MHTSHLVFVGCVAAAVVSLSGCALPTRAWYEGLQTGAQNNCNQQPPGAREECLSRLNKKSYDAYEQERSPAR